MPSTVSFIRQIQELVHIPVGIKLCVGSLKELKAFVDEMKHQDTFPDWITVDGGEGGTGAAPGVFLDRVGMPLYPALHGLVEILKEAGVRDRLKIFAAGKLIDAGRQTIAFALGADACYTARGFMLALGCIQARECGNNTCPVGITTQDPGLQGGLVIEEKARRVCNYAENTLRELRELTVSMGKPCPSKLTVEDIFIPSGSNLWNMVAAHSLQKETIKSTLAE